MLLRAEPYARTNGAFQLTALFLVAFNLRVTMACIGPLLDFLRTDLQMSRAELGLLSTGPVLCMGLFAPFAQRLSAKWGHENAILAATAIIAASALVRWIANAWILLVSAFAAGIGIAIAGTLLNTFVKHYFADRAVTVSGLYSAGLCLGAALAASLTAPLAALTDSWRVALAAWSIPGLLAVVLWWWMLRIMRAPERATQSSTISSTSSHLPWRSGRAWLVTAFFGTQSIVFYVVLAWLAPMYIELGWSAARAGALLGLWVGVQVATILFVARAASRSSDRRPWLLTCSGAAIVSLLGFAFAPLSAPWLWAILLSFACGGWFPLAMNLPLDYSNTPNEAGGWTALMLFGGYLLSAGSPSAAGWARDAGSSYRSIFAALAFLSVLALVLALSLRPRHPEVGRPEIQSG
jgi:MFS transporter, CP family, cyanate transporter